MISCQCENPKLPVDPRREGWCAHCLRRLDPKWLSESENGDGFFVRLEEALFPGGESPEAFTRFREHCEARHEAGKERFGLDYLTRENEREALEEAADLGNYMYFTLLQSRRAGEEEEWSLALEAAHHAYLAHKCSEELAAKRRVPS